MRAKTANLVKESPLFKIGKMLAVAELASNR
jgi:hypothetical protein